MTEKRDPVDIFCNIGIFTFTSTMVHYYLRLSRIKLLHFSDAGIFLICTATILLFLSLRIAGNYETRDEIITATVFMIIVAIIYPFGIYMILKGADRTMKNAAVIAPIFSIWWFAIAISAIRTCRIALKDILAIQMINVRNQALEDLRNAEISGAKNTEEHIALALIAAEKDLADKPELLTEYRRTLAEHAVLSGRPGTYFVEIAEELINNDRISF